MMIAQRTRGRLGLKIHFDPERFQNIRAAALRSGARLPCLATGTPAAATTSATLVEILNVFRRSPPVPQTSRISMRELFSSMGGWIDNSRNADAKAAISSGVSPFCAKAVRNSALVTGATLSPTSTSTAKFTFARVSDFPGFKLLGEQLHTRSVIGYVRLCQSCLKAKKKAREDGCFELSHAQTKPPSTLESPPRHKQREP